MVASVPAWLAGHATHVHNRGWRRTFGTAMAKSVGLIMPKYNMPYTIVEEIAYDPTARDLSVEIAKAKTTGAEALMAVSRADDAILLTCELVKQRWSPMAILSVGPGWNENDYFKTLGKLADGPMSFINISIGPVIQFNEKGQNDKLKNAAIQNRAGKFVIIAPKAQSDAKPELPMTPYDKRG